MYYKEYPVFHNYETLEYGRKSRTDDPLLTDDEILEKHSKIIEEYAIKNLGGPIPEENKYMEIVSGESLKDRPKITKLLKAIESPDIKAVAVVEVQRLSRGDLEDIGRLVRLLRYTNTYVITPHKIYDLRDEYDRDAFERELKRGNEYLEYYKKIQARGRLASVKEGNYIGSIAPYGFDKIVKKFDNKECHTLIEKKEEADVVRLIFDWYCNERLGVGAICRRLEELNIKTRKNRPYWRPPNIYGILENVHYIGCVHWNWRKTLTIIKDQEIKKLRPKAKVNEYLIFEGKHDGIISKELFDEAQRIRGSKPRAKTDTTLRNCLSGLMFCKCGEKMKYKSTYKNGVDIGPGKLACSRQSACKNGSVNYDEVIEYLCETLTDCVRDFEILIDDDQDDSVKLHLNIVRNLEEKLEMLNEKEVLQWEAQYDPDPEKRLPEHVFKQLNKKLLAEKEEIKEALCKAQKNTPQPVNYRNKVLSFKKALAALEDPDESAEDKNMYLKDIIKCIKYERPATIRITKNNAHLYQDDVEKGLTHHAEPYKIELILK